LGFEKGSEVIPREGLHYFNRIWARYFLLIPKLNRERISKSIETEGSPFSILATLDWLEANILANCA
jgi:hypothetical protein